MADLSPARLEPGWSDDDSVVGAAELLSGRVGRFVRP